MDITCPIGRILDILWLLYSSNFLIIFFIKKTIIKHFIPYYIWIGNLFS